MPSCMTFREGVYLSMEIVYIVADSVEQNPSRMSKCDIYKHSPIYLKIVIARLLQLLELPCTNSPAAEHLPIKSELS